MVKVVHKSVKLILVNIEESASTSLDSLDDPDVVSKTSSPPFINGTAAILNSQATAFIDRGHLEGHKFFLASEKRPSHDCGLVVA